MKKEFTSDNEFWESIRKNTSKGVSRRFTPLELSLMQKQKEAALTELRNRLASERESKNIKP